MRKLNLDENNRKNIFAQIDRQLVKRALEKSSNEGIRSFRELLEKLLKQYVDEKQ